MFSPMQKQNNELMTPQKNLQSLIEPKQYAFSKNEALATVGKKVHILSYFSNLTINMIEDEAIIEMGCEETQTDDWLKCNSHLPPLSRQQNINKYQLLITGDIGNSITIICHAPCDVEIIGSVGVSCKIHVLLAGNITLNKAGFYSEIYTRDGDISICKRISKTVSVRTGCGSINGVSQSVKPKSFTYPNQVSVPITSNTSQEPDTNDIYNGPAYNYTTISSTPPPQHSNISKESKKSGSFIQFLFSGSTTENPSTKPSSPSASPKPTREPF